MVTKTEKAKSTLSLQSDIVFFAILYFIEGINYSSRLGEM